MKLIIISLALMVCWVSCAPAEAPSTTTSKPTTQFVKLSCKGHDPNKMFVDAKDPSIFHQCSHGVHIATFHCQPNLVFEEKEQVCVRPHKEELKCPEKTGLFPYPGNIHKFIECYDNHAFVRTCAADLIFDDKKDECVYNEGNSPWPSDPTTVPTKAPTTAEPTVHIEVTTKSSH